VDMHPSPITLINLIKSYYLLVSVSGYHELIWAGGGGGANLGEGGANLGGGANPGKHGYNPIKPVFNCAHDG
jgi:hypothetical protein